MLDFDEIAAEVYRRRMAGLRFLPWEDVHASLRQQWAETVRIAIEVAGE